MDTERGTCNPSIPTLAAATGYAQSTVRDALNAIVLAGLLVRRRGVGRGHSTWYKAILKNRRESAVFHSDNGRKAPAEPSKTAGSRRRTLLTHDDGGALKSAAPSGVFDEATLLAQVAELEAGSP
jgi:DNA-binding transcriptional MocR family regulator